MYHQSAQHNSTLVTAQSHGPVLVMVAWFLVCILAIFTAARLVIRFTSQSPHHLPVKDDVFVTASSLCALGSTIIISTAVDSGLGKRSHFIDSNAMEKIQMKLYAYTFLFVLAAGLSKCSVVLFLYRLARSSVQRVCVVVVAIVLLIWTTAVMAGIVFQCEMPKPWAMWTGQCIPLVPFWITAIAIETFVETALILLLAHMIWTMQLEYHQRILTTSVSSLRVLLVVLSIIRIAYVQRSFSTSVDLTYSSTAYIITTQFHSTISVILTCILALKPFATLFQPSTSPPASASAKHWSGSTIGGAPYTFSTSAFEVIKEPLSSIQTSMSTPSSPCSSRDRLAQDILPMTRYAKAPPRPPPPSEEQRPDLSMFTKRGTVREPPMVTRLGSRKRNERVTS